MKVLRPLSAACVAIALSPSTTVDAFSPSRVRNNRIRHFPAKTHQVVSTSLSSTAVPLDVPTNIEPPHSPAQRRAAAEASARARYQRSSYSTPAAWSDFCQTDPLLSTIRTELVSKYLTLGRSQLDAVAEVDAFLDDEERSGEYIEMRRCAASAREEAMGFEDAVMYLGAFCAGALVDVALRLAAEHLDVSVPFFS